MSAAKASAPLHFAGSMSTSATQAPPAFMGKASRAPEPVSALARFQEQPKSQASDADSSDLDRSGHGSSSSKLSSTSIPGAESVPASTSNSISTSGLATSTTPASTSTSTPARAVLGGSDPSGPVPSLGLARGKSMRNNLLHKLRAPPLVHVWDFWHERQSRAVKSGGIARGEAGAGSGPRETTSNHPLKNSEGSSEMKASKSTDVAESDCSSRTESQEAAAVAATSGDKLRMEESLSRASLTPESCQSSQSSYNPHSRLVKLHTINDVRGFWELFNNFNISALQLRDSIHLFHRDVKPEWESPRNIRGGAWTFRVRQPIVSEFWKEVCLMAIGETLQAAVASDRKTFLDDICGVSLTVRYTSYLVSVWNRDADHQGGIAQLLETILSHLPDDLKPTQESSYFYKRHSEHVGFCSDSLQTASTSSSSTNPSTTLNNHMNHIKHSHPGRGETNQGMEHNNEAKDHYQENRKDNSNKDCHTNDENDKNITTVNPHSGSGAGVAKAISSRNTSTSSDAGVQGEKKHPTVPTSGDFVRSDTNRDHNKVISPSNDALGRRGMSTTSEAGSDNSGGSGFNSDRSSGSGSGVSCSSRDTGIISTAGESYEARQKSIT